ncbi:hypothetical protein ACFX43_22100 [Nocardioides sp. YIM B13467]|uniref:hypothetical protein n=1 Tax=Nocardioides sp. YIM B13467 TaxID=3366294 RepID=UPI00366F5A3C
MLLAHAIAIAEVRSYIAALADSAATVLGSVAYDRVLIYLDSVHGDQVPATTEIPLDDPATMYRLAQQSTSDLRRYGLDGLHIELALAYLTDAWTLDHSLDGHGARLLPSWIDPTESS